MVKTARKTPGNTRKQDAGERRVTAIRSAQVLSDDEFLEDLLNHFESLPGFSFVADFPNRERTEQAPLGPTLISVFDLLVCARQGSDYLGPYVDGIRKVAFGGIDYAMAGNRRREIVTAVESRIAELRRRGIEFAICWCAYGDDPRLDWSGDENELYVYQRLSEHPKELFDMLVE